MSTNAHGVFHVVGSVALSPYDAAISIAQVFGCSLDLVQKTTFAEMFKDRAPVPQFAVLTQKKTEAAGIHPRSFVDGITEVKAQES